MPPYSQNSNDKNSNPYTPDEYEKTKTAKILKIAVVILVAVGILIAVYLALFSGGQDKNTKAAADAAKKVTPNAEVRKVKVADGFAIAIVSDPTAKGQASAGNTTIFRVSADGSMTQIANGSYFSSIDLLGLGIPLATQVKLTERNFAQVQKDLSGECGYSGGNVPGYIGFSGSFNPGGWQIDAATLDGLEQALTASITNKNAVANEGNKVICINATREKSNVVTSAKTYISTFTLELQFITGNGTVSSHTFTFATGPNHYRSYTLDGQKIQAS